MARRGIYGIVTLFTGFSLVVSACAPAAGTTVATPVPVKLRIVNQAFISFAPFHIALAEGFFAAQGIDAELVPINQTQEVIPALLGGTVDVAAGQLTAGIFNTIARGGSLVITADKGYIDPDGCDNLAVLARATLFDETDPNTEAGLRGRTITVNPGSWNEYFLDRLLTDAGLDPAEVVKTTMPTPAQPDALSQGTIDLSVQNEPWVMRLKTLGHQPVLKPITQLLPGAQTAVTFFGPKLTGENAAVGERFMVAYLQAVRQYNEGKTDRNLAIMAEANGLDVETLKAMCWPALRADGQVSLDSLLDFQAWALAAGHVEQTLTPEQFWDPRYVQAATAALQ